MFIEVIISNKFYIYQLAKDNFLSNIICGMVSGAVSNALATPTDVLKVILYYLMLVLVELRRKSLEKGKHLFNLTVF